MSIHHIRPTQLYLQFVLKFHIYISTYYSIVDGHKSLITTCLFSIDMQMNSSMCTHHTSRYLHLYIYISMYIYLSLPHTTNIPLMRLDISTYISIYLSSDLPPFPILYDMLMVYLECHIQTAIPSYTPITISGNNTPL